MSSEGSTFLFKLSISEWDCPTRYALADGLLPGTVFFSKSRGVARGCSESKRSPRLGKALAAVWLSRESGIVTRDLKLGIDAFTMLPSRKSWCFCQKATGGGVPAFEPTRLFLGEDAFCLQRATAAMQG